MAVSMYIIGILELSTSFPFFSFSTPPLFLFRFSPISLFLPNPPISLLLPISIFPLPLSLFICLLPSIYPLSLLIFSPSYVTRYRNEVNNDMQKDKLISIYGGGRGQVNMRGYQSDISYKYVSSLLVISQIIV